jgi:hypothetical protein
MDRLPNGDKLNMGKMPVSKPKGHEFFENIDDEIKRQMSDYRNAGQNRMKAR